MRARLPALLLTVLLIAPAGALRAETPGERPAPEERDDTGREDPKPAEPPAEPERRRAPAQERPDRKSGDAEAPRPARLKRRALEEAPKPPEETLLRRERLLAMPLHASRGCAIPGQERLVKRLLSLRNRSQVMSLEVWGDTRAYRDGQKVLFYARVPFRSYLTVFWIGPEGSIFAPFDNVPIPAHRNVEIDADAVIVPPLGHERWVAVATLEPVPMPCGVPEGPMLGWLEEVLALPHAVGRWEVWSGEETKRKDE